MTDGDEVAVPYIHVVEMKTRAGKTFNKDVLCAKSDPDDPTPCERCDESGEAPYRRSVFVVFVTDIIHADRGRTKGSEHWEAVRSGGVTRYREVVNDVRILAAKPKLEAQIIEAYDGDPLADDYETRVKTLLDRPFDLSRTDDQRAPEVLRYPEEPKPMAPEVKELFDAAVVSLGTLEEIVERNFGEGKPQRRTAATSRGTTDAGGFDPDSGGFREGDDDLEELDF